MTGCGRRGRATTVRFAMDATRKCGSAAAMTRRGVAIEKLVELRRGRREGGCLVVGDMLGEGSSFDRSVKKAGDDTAPDDNGESKRPEDSAYAYENGTIWEGRVIHERCVLSRRDSRWGVLWNYRVDRLGERGKARQSRRCRSRRGGEVGKACQGG